MIIYNNKATHQPELILSNTSYRFSITTSGIAEH